MKKLLTLFIFILVFAGSKNAVAQINLVQNPSMEDWSVRHELFGDYIFANNWYRPTEGQSGYFTMDTISYAGSVPVNDFGVRYPIDGRAYSGIYLRWDTAWGVNNNYREYLEVELNEFLKPNNCYCLYFYVSLEDSATIAVYNLGAYFSTNFVYESTPGPISNYHPQISNPEGNYLSSKNWTKIKGHFIANGQEKYMIIGNFCDDYETPFIVVRNQYTNPDWVNGAEYYIDMVNLIECDNPIKQATAGNDKIICLGDSSTLGSFNNQYYDYEWQPAIGLSNPKCGTPNASPAVTTTYTLTQKYFDFPVSTDEVTLAVKDCQEPEGLIVYPNPVVDNITFKLLNGVFTNGKIEIYDVIGRKILTLLPNDINIISAEMSIYAKGTYLYRAYSEDKMLGVGKFLIQ